MAPPIEALHAGGYRHGFAPACSVAGEMHPLLKLALVVAEGTGRRISAWRNLRWDDVDFQTCEIRWRAEFDRSGSRMSVR